ncbi:MAG: threonine synthase [Rickettsiales bacterium]
MKPVLYRSTRSQNSENLVDFRRAALAGLAPDGGLYFPTHMPEWTREDFLALRGKPYADVAFAVMRPFIGDAVPEDELRSMVRQSYESFAHSAVAPLTQLSERLFMLELFHGPTLAFKDFALQFLGRILHRFLGESGEKLAVIGATSGDTGSAALYGCYESPHVSLFILHPHKRVSDVQRRQMTTLIADNVHNVAIEGNFDDCQAIVKKLLYAAPFEAAGIRLGAVNSVNWCRIVAQIAYYVYAALALGAPDRAVSFSVPTGNFGDIFAGYVAGRMGLPIKKLIVATNANDILYRFFSRNDYRRETLSHTLAPSMDIQSASNFERLLFDLNDHDGAKTARLMEDFAQRGMVVPEETFRKTRDIFAARRCDDAQTMATMRETLAKTGQYIDPHTATGVYAAERYAEESEEKEPVVALATAHRAKFPDACRAALYPNDLPLPPALAALEGKTERYDVVSADYDAVREYIARKL